MHCRMLEALQGHYTVLGTSHNFRESQGLGKLHDAEDFTECWGQLKLQGGINGC